MFRKSCSILHRAPFFRGFLHRQQLSLYSTHTGKPPSANTKSVCTRQMSELGLSALAAKSHSSCYYNLSYGELADLQARNKEGIYASNGAFVVNTGKFTGRSAKDKYIVRQSPSAQHVWWGNVNKPMEPQIYQTLKHQVHDYYKNTVQNVYVFDCYCGAHPRSRKKVRFVTETAWHQHFVKNMFIEAEPHELKDFEPDFTVINCWNLVNEKWKKHGLNSETYVAFNMEEKTALIGSAWYGGEMKKGIFSMMHYWLPMENILSMHCAANVGIENDDVCIFFGLSGTGKTTLSTDPHRKLIGDDEHGWDNDGIFNFEGGCYAKTGNLSRDNEPEIFDAIRFNALLENVWIDPHTRDPDYSNVSLTENGRVSYTIEHIENREQSLSGEHPSYIVFLCCDAFGVLSPIAKLSPGQAMYHFISGYTAKVAGTERGIKEPTATFSPCYGAAFLTRPPVEYGALFKQKLEEHGTECYLVNTGWSGGGYGVGQRMSIDTTRSCLNAIFDGSIQDAEYRTDPVFGFEVPISLDGVDSHILDAKNTWCDKQAYDRQYRMLADLFANNIAEYSKNVAEYFEFGPTLAVNSSTSTSPEQMTKHL